MSLHSLQNKIFCIPISQLLKSDCFLVCFEMTCSWGKLGIPWKRIIKIPWIFSNFSFGGGSIIENSIIVINKGYYYVINLGISSNFYVSIDPFNPRSFARGSIVANEQRNLGVFLLHRSSTPLSIMGFDRAWLEQHL